MALKTETELAPDEAARDRRFMRAALAFGARNLGRTAPNPAVGALVVREGVIVGRGATRPGGRPHAETIALADAGEAARGATLYVTLEPCSHHGLTPPCADAIVAAGIARVVSAIEDPDPRVSGRGHARLAAAGVATVVGVCADEARRANLGHILRTREGRPMLTLKLAETADGYAAAGEHDPRLMITGLAANNRVQMMRASCEAIMVGVGTALADDPLMTVRLPGLDAYRPLRIVLDTALRLPLRSRLVVTARERPVLVVASDAASPERERALREAGVEVERVDVERVAARAARLDLAAALGRLAARGLTRVFSEGGPTVAAALIEKGLVDEVALFTAPKPLAREGVRALGAEARARLADPRAFALVEDARVGHDRLRRYERV
ncbi:MAG: bifunctional diaminohydroxyphosphoribosylaminopyrimidine deaminase/5-amino-6-(5-phosphoribosylamino)uracil reductase RibD [Rhizobiales bacterium]|nr:bifunctional diaminohydroxyphosphoribosylaminopyrimidine deaminase/5-amino-6-(5-phosphoribosylamino)uracil reductase RibD [Hyphomicrobiales bacterium]